jgi:hypothetical protein
LESQLYRIPVPLSIFQEKGKERLRI